MGIQHHIPHPPNPAPPRVEELEINFEPQAASDINFSDFIEENIQFADTEHSTANIRPSGIADPADIEGNSQREANEETRRREIEERERKEREETTERER